MPAIVVSRLPCVFVILKKKRNGVTPGVCNLVTHTVPSFFPLYFWYFYLIAFFLVWCLDTRPKDACFYSCGFAVAFIVRLLIIVPCFFPLCMTSAGQRSTSFLFYYFFIIIFLLPSLAFRWWWERERLQIKRVLLYLNCFLFFFLILFMWKGGRRWGGIQSNCDPCQSLRENGRAFCISYFLIYLFHYT
jgi:hypothetical protein